MNKVHFLYCKMQLLLFLSPSCFLIAAKYKMMSGKCFHFSKYTKKKNTLEWKRKSRFSGCYKRFTILCQTQPNTKKTAWLDYYWHTQVFLYIHTHKNIMYRELIKGRVWHVCRQFWQDIKQEKHKKVIMRKK